MIQKFVPKNEKNIVPRIDIRDYLEKAIVNKKRHICLSGELGVGKTTAVHDFVNYMNECSDLDYKFYTISKSILRSGSYDELIKEISEMEHAIFIINDFSFANFGPDDEDDKVYEIMENLNNFALGLNNFALKDVHFIYIQENYSYDVEELKFFDNNSVNMYVYEPNGILLQDIIAKMCIRILEEKNLKIDEFSLYAILKILYDLASFVSTLDISYSDGSVLTFVNEYIRNKIFKALERGQENVTVSDFDFDIISFNDGQNKAR